MSGLQDDLKIDDAEEECPEGHVRLHVLCDNCKKFVGLHHDALGKLSEATEIDPFVIVDWTTDLFGGAEKCHLCNILLAGFRLERSHESSLAHEETSRGILLVVKFKQHTVAKVYLPNAPIERVELALIRYGLEDSMAHVSEVNDDWNKDLRAHLRWTHAPQNLEHNVEMLSSWLNTCTKGHRKCLEFQKRAIVDIRRPARILEIGPHSIILRCDPPFENEYTYATLSHVWGDPTHQLRLVSSTLLEYQNGIPIERLPIIFKKAVHLARAIGLRYIWIDALCIVQDSPSDWQQEAPRMASIYGNALCNLACLFPPNDVQDFPCVDSRSNLPCILDPASTRQPGLYAFRRSCNHLECFAQADKQDYCFRVVHGLWPLNTRAWTLQEHLICPRTIFFGWESLMWECSQIFCDEWLGPTPINSPLSKKAFADHVQERDLYKIHMDRFALAWIRSVSMYRTRCLTHHGDRVVAFAGIARGVHNISQFTYLAGLWAEDMNYSLLWRLSYVESKERFLIEEPAVQSAPSWSWFSIPIRRNCVVTTIDRTRSNYMERQPSSLVLFEWADRPCEGQPPWSFHDFEGLKITLRVLLVSTQCLWRKGYGFLEAFDSLYDSGDPDNATNYCLKAGDIATQISTLKGLKSWSFDVYMDDRLDYEVPPTDCTLCLLVEARKRWHGFNDEIERCTDRLAGLLITPGPGDNTWRRIGLWEAELQFYYGEPQKIDKGPEIFRNFRDVISKEIVLV